MRFQPRATYRLTPIPPVTQEERQIQAGLLTALAAGFGLMLGLLADKSVQQSAPLGTAAGGDLLTAPYSPSTPGPSCGCSVCRG